MKKLLVSLTLLTSLSSFATTVVLDKKVSSRSLSSCDEASKMLTESIDKVTERQRVLKVRIQECKVKSLGYGAKAYYQHAMLEIDL